MSSQVISSLVAEKPFILIPSSGGILAEVRVVSYR